MGRKEAALGAVGGAGGAVALREKFDVKNGVQKTVLVSDSSRLAPLMRPSVLFGLGGGAAAATIAFLDKNNRKGMLSADMEDGLKAFGAAGMTVGVISALMPKEAGTTTAARNQREAARRAAQVGTRASPIPRSRTSALTADDEIAIQPANEESIVL